MIQKIYLSREGGKLYKNIRVTYRYRPKPFSGNPHVFDKDFQLMEGKAIGSSDIPKLQEIYRRELSEFKLRGKS